MLICRWQVLESGSTACEIASRYYKMAKLGLLGQLLPKKTFEVSGLKKSWQPATRRHGTQRYLRIICISLFHSQNRLRLFHLGVNSAHVALSKWENVAGNFAERNCTSYTLLMNMQPTSYCHSLNDALADAQIRRKRTDCLCMRGSKK